MLPWGPSLNPGYCWNEVRNSSNQQERIKLVNTKIKTYPEPHLYINEVLRGWGTRAYSTQALSDNHKYWLGGFVEGEGSLLVSIVTNPKVKHGIALQPEFNVTQHESGLNVLNSYKALFNGLGNLKEKSGSNQVWVYSLKGTKNIKELVLPYYEEYVVPFSSKHKSDVFNRFKSIIDVLYTNHGGATAERWRLG
jgi:hypothetical protein